MPQYSAQGGNLNGRLLQTNHSDGHVQLFDHEDQVDVSRRSRRTTRPNAVKILSILVAVLFVLSVAFLAAFVIFGLKKQGDVCMSSHCIKLAANLLSSLDESVKPCDDFYQFACGNWIKTHPIPDDRAAVSNFEQPTIDVEYALKTLLENETMNPHSSVENAKSFYKACENDTAVHNSWRRTFNETVRKLGGWPILDRRWRPPGPDFQISRLYGHLTINFSQDSLFKFTVGADDKNSSNQVFQVDQASLTLMVREFYLMPEGHEERDAYLELMTETVLHLGANVSTARREMAEVMFFETQLANITRDENKHDIESSYYKTTLRELKKSINKFDWTAYFDAIYPHVDWKPDTDIILYCLEFLEDLNRLLSAYDQRIVTNYLMWRWFYSEVLPQLTDPFFMVHFKFHRSLQNMKVPQLRWHSCVRQVNTHMFHATGAMYVDAHFHPSAKQRAAEMIEMIKEAFHESLKENEWLSHETRQVASEKVDSMILKTGYPDFILNFKEVDAFYKDFVNFDGDFFRTKFLFEYLNNRVQFNRIHEPVDKTRWTSGSAVVNAFYSPNTNEIMFPAGILQPVFYSEHYPWSMNFGGIGVVIGHEITHGFDDKGRQYDKDGNIREWWDNATIQMFEEKAKCIEDQYSNYVVPQVNLNINGKNTKGENIADNGGLKQAYKAYLRWSADHTPEQLLPGLRYTHNQLFFINYAQIWCGSMNDKEFVRKIKTSVHSPGIIRVKGPLQNSVDFAKAFDCEPGSGMNPEKKCKVW